MSKRIHIPKSYKQYLYEKQNGRCNSCCCELEITAQCDHKRPLWAHGSNRIHNLQLLCCNCHARKTLHESKLIPKRIKNTSMVQCKICNIIFSMYFDHICPEWKDVTNYDCPLYLD